MDILRLYASSGIFLGNAGSGGCIPGIIAYVRCPSWTDRNFDIDLQGFISHRTTLSPTPRGLCPQRWLFRLAELGGSWRASPFSRKIFLITCREFTPRWLVSFSFWLYCRSRRFPIGEATGLYVMGLGLNLWKVELDFFTRCKSTCRRRRASIFE